MLNFESEGLLYRGEDPAAPTEIWDYPRKRWVPFHDGRFHGGPGRVIDAAEAERLKADNPAAEHFMYYDIPPWRQPLSQEYRDAVRPTHVLEAIAERRRQPGKTGPQDD